MDEGETWEKEHGLPEKPLPANAGISLDEPMIDPLGVLIP